MLFPVLGNRWDDLLCNQSKSGKFGYPLPDNRMEVVGKGFFREKLQTMYFKLGGNYMYAVHRVRKGGAEYNLYALTLGDLKDRLNAKASQALNKGKASMVLDACMIVVRKGKAQGTMNDQDRFLEKYIRLIREFPVRKAGAESHTLPFTIISTKKFRDCFSGWMRLQGKGLHRFPVVESIVMDTRHV